MLNLNLKESLSQAETLSFLMPYNNAGYNLMQGLSTKAKVIDTRDNSVVFSGRVIPSKHSMSSEGKFEKEITCEGALNYLNDTNTRQATLQNQTPTQILTYLLSQHNSKVDNSRKIQLGTVEITTALTISTNYETTLNIIITKIRNILGGDIRVRETAGVLYLDYLQQIGSNNGVKIQLGYNMKDITVDYDPTSIVTRLIPLGFGEGVNQLGIESVNTNVDYIEDATAIAKYGIIEDVKTNKDIQDPNTLKLWGQNVLNENKQEKLTLETTQLDLSILAGHEGEKYGYGDTLNVLNSVMNIDVYARAVGRERDLINSPWNPKLTISTKPITLTNEIIDLKQRSLSLENAPQGSTYIDTFGYAENIDATHSFQLPIWLSPDILNVNRVRLHIDSQKFRAYEKGVASGGGSTATSAAGGDGTYYATEFQGGDVGSTTDVSTQNIARFMDGTSVREYIPTYTKYADGTGSHRHDIDYDTIQNIMQHLHHYTLPSHSHKVMLPSHSHKVAIPPHAHGIQYGIFEDAYPSDVQVKINNTTIPNVSLNEGESLDLDITQYVYTPGQTYNLEVTSSRNGRVNVWVSVQAFIQIK